MHANADFSRLIRNAEDAQHHAAGTVICRKGDPAHCLYVVRAGEVEVRLDGRVIDRFGPGEILGEMALVDASPRSADIVAVSDCELVAVDERRFQFLVQQAPFFALDVMRVLARRLRRADGLEESPAA